MKDLELKRAMYPRVSDIIGKKNADTMRGIPLEVLENASIRGTKVHQYCTSHSNGLLLPAIESEYESYVSAWIEWETSNVQALMRSNERLYDDTLCFSGEFDMIVRMANEKTLTLVDIKTSAKPANTWPIQLAAYKHLCIVNGIDVQRICIVHLKKNHKKEVTAKRIDYDVDEYLPIFFSALSCYKYFFCKESNI